MVNLLTNALISTINDRQIETSYKLFIYYHLLVEEGKAVSGIPEQVINLFYKGKPPEPIEASASFVWFLRGGSLEQDEAPTVAPIQELKAYSFKDDEGVIIADFAQYYGIRLASEDLHWWEFKKLYESLPAESQIKQRIYIRTANLAELDKPEANRVRKLRKKLALGKLKTITREEADQREIDYINKRYEEMEAYNLKKKMEQTAEAVK